MKNFKVIIFKKNNKREKLYVRNPIPTNFQQGIFTPIPAKINGKFRGDGK